MMRYNSVSVMTLFVRCSCVLVPLFWILCGTAFADSTSTLPLIMASPYDKRHALQHKVFAPWVEEIQTKSKGAIKIDQYDASTLLTEFDAYAPLVIGALNVAGVLPMTLHPIPPVSNLFAYHLDAPNSHVASRIVWDVVQTHKALQAELQMMHLLWAWSSSPVYIHTSTKPVTTIAELQGLKLLVWTDLLERFILSVGGIPVRCLPAETASMLRKGLAEGVLCPIPPLISFDISSYINFTTCVPLVYYSFYMGINKEVWYALPPEHKALLTETTGRAMAIRCGLALDVAQNEVQQQLLEQGHVFIPASKEFQQQCQDHLARLRQQYLTNIKGLNLPGMSDFSPLIREIRAAIRREDAGKH
ncbi:MAG: TRAP transporter substrate-binding protein DctP [Desulfovibrionaceae bacterium]